MSVYCEHVNSTGGGANATFSASFRVETTKDVANLHAALMDSEYVNYVVSHREEIKEMAITVRKLREL